MMWETNRGNSICTVMLCPGSADQNKWEESRAGKSSQSSLTSIRNHHNHHQRHLEIITIIINVIEKSSSTLLEIITIIANISKISSIESSTSLRNNHKHYPHLWEIIRIDHCQYIWEITTTITNNHHQQQCVQIFSKLADARFQRSQKKFLFTMIKLKAAMQHFELFIAMDSLYYQASCIIISIIITTFSSITLLKGIFWE